MGGAKKTVFQLKFPLHLFLFIKLSKTKIVTFKPKFALKPSALPQALLFDWDGTLIDSVFFAFNVFAETLKHYQKPAPSFEEYLCAPHYSIQDSFKKIFGPESPKAETLFRHKWTSSYQKHIKPMAEAATLLHFLKQRGVVMGVVSNKEGDLVRKEARELGFQSFFSVITGSRDTPEDKPSATPLLISLKKIGLIASADIWFAGDSEVDILCAKRAGCTPVAMMGSALAYPEPSIHAKTCKGLYDLLKNL